MDQTHLQAGMGAGLKIISGTGGQKDVICHFYPDTAEHCGLISRSAHFNADFIIFVVCIHPVNDKSFDFMRWIDKKNIFFLFLPLLFVACIDDEGTEVEAHADAYVIQKKIGDEVKVATAYYAFANTGLASVTVTPSPGIGDPFELEGDTLSITSFYK